MNVLLLGVGMQGRGALHDLVRQDAVTSIVAADRDLDALESWVAARGYGARVRCRHLDASEPGALDALFAAGVDPEGGDAIGRGGFEVVIDLLPVLFVGAVATAAVRAGVHLVNTFYVTPEVRALAPEAASRGVTLLPEMGMDPGIDLVLCGDAARAFDDVTEILVYGSGIPEPGAEGNPLRYKVSWTFEGVLASYHREGTLVEGGRVVRVGPHDQLRPEHVHTVEIEDVGALECYPNGDVIGYLELLGIDPARVQRAGRYSMRWPGHAAFWRPLVELGLLDDEPVLIDGRQVERRRFLAAALEPRLRYRPDERDLAILRIAVAGLKDGRPGRIVHEVLDRRDLDTGLLAMNRLVGFTAVIGALMVASGEISRPGLVSPVVDVPAAPFVEALRARGVEVRTRREGSVDDPRGFAP